MDFEMERLRKALNGSPLIRRGANVTIKRQYGIENSQSGNKILRALSRSGRFPFLYLSLYSA